MVVYNSIIDRVNLEGNSNYALERYLIYKIKCYWFKSCVKVKQFKI